MDVKNKQRAIIDFLLLEGCAGEEILIRLRNVALQYSHGSAKFAEPTNNSETKDGPGNTVDAKLMRRFGQLDKTTRMPR
jgi:hypothetical protein